MATSKTALAKAKASKKSSKCSCKLKKIAILGAIFSVLYSVYFYVDRYILPTFFIFEPEVLHQIVKESIAPETNNITEIFVRITSQLKKHYGENINDFNTDDWMFNNAGGAMGSMFILHASVSEYMIFFGTATGTEGHTGVHMADDYFNIIYGEQWAHKLGDPLPEIYKPGDVHHLRRGVSKQYSMPTTCWALELAQGWIPAMLPFGFLDTFSSTLDIETIARTVYYTAKAMISSILKGKI
ncbi:ERG2/sigma1 receptor-like protein [Dipodascopsis uninucleata]